MPSPYDALPAQHGFIFTGNDREGGTYIGPSYGTGANFAATPQLQSRWDTTNPTFQAQYQAEQQRAMQAQQMAMQMAQQQRMQAPPTPQGFPAGGAQPGTQPGQQPAGRPQTLADTLKSPGTTQRGVNPVYPNPPVPTGSNPQSYIMPGAPGPAVLSPAGRPLSAMQGTPFQSQQERDWFYSLYGQPLPGGGAIPPSGSGPTTRFQPPATGDAGLYQAAAAQTAQQYGLDPNYFMGLLGHESGWDPQAVNAASGAAGLGQFLPTTAAAYGTTPERLRSDPYHAIDTAARLLSDNTRTFQGNPLMGLAAYFIGPGNVQQAVMQGGQQGWLDSADRIAAQYGQGSVSNWLRLIGALPAGR